MFGDPRGNGSREALESGLKQLTSFLRVPRLPGKARLNRREPGDGAGGREASPGPGSSRRGAGAGGSAALQQQQQQPPEGSGQQQASQPPEKQQQPQSQAGAAAAGPAAAEAPPEGAPGPGSSSARDGEGGGRQQAEQRMHGSGEPSTSAPGAAAAGAEGANGGGSSSSLGGAAVSQSRASSAIRVAKFHRLLSEPVVDLDALRELSWSGIPPELRPLCWRLLLGYLPPNRARQAQVLLRKRREYAEMVPGLYDISNSERSEDEIGALRQVTVDVPRTAPGVPFFHAEVIQSSLRRMLYIWGIRHPASGYVQGMNDLVTPFVAVFLSECFKGPMEDWRAEDLSEAAVLDVEADCYWCLCKLLEGIQDHYTYAQPGIQRTVFRLKELVRKQHEPLVAHMEREGVDFLQFAFRWVNCLLIREVPFAPALRLWDTYLAEGPKFPDFLVYVCAAFLARWERMLLALEFQEMMLLLQKLPTQDWGEAEVESVLSAAFVLRNVWQHAQSHLQA